MFCTRSLGTRTCVSWILDRYCFRSPRRNQIRLAVFAGSVFKAMVNLSFWEQPFHSAVILLKVLWTYTSCIWRSLNQTCGYSILGVSFLSSSSSFFCTTWSNVWGRLLPRHKQRPLDLLSVPALSAWGKLWQLVQYYSSYSWPAWWTFSMVASWFARYEHCVQIPWPLFYSKSVLFESWDNVQLPPAVVL